MKTNKILLVLIIGMFLVSLVSAENIGTFKQNQIMEITNYCATADCSYANISSITYPNGTIIYLNEVMTMTENEFNYSYTPTETGKYFFKTCSDPNSIEYCELDDFEITPNGEEISGGQIAIYLGLIIILLIAFIFTIFTIFNIESFGWRMGLTSFAYIIANGFLLVCWKTAEMFLTSVPYLETIFRVLYIVSNIGYFPMFLIILVISLMHMTDEKNIQTLMDRGFTEDQARWRNKRS